MNQLPGSPYRQLLRFLVPPWLSDRWPAKKSVGFRLLYSWSFILDELTEWTWQGLRAKWPTYGTPTAVPTIGRDRRIIRGPNEPIDAYALRLVGWLDAWRRAGTAIGVLLQLVPFFAPNTAPLMRLVNAHGVWYGLQPGDTTAEAVNIAHQHNWNWGNPPIPFVLNPWARCWPIIYSDNDYPWTPEGIWDDPGTWGEDGVLDFSASVSEIQTLLQIIGQWKAAHSLYVRPIVAFDGASFDPSNPEPDGQWGKAYKLVLGPTPTRKRATPSRLLTASYLSPVT